MSLFSVDHNVYVHQCGEHHGHREHREIMHRLASIEAQLEALTEGLLDDEKLAVAKDKLAVARKALQAELDKQPETKP